MSSGCHILLVYKLDHTVDLLLIFFAKHHLFCVSEETLDLIPVKGKAPAKH